MTTKAAGILFVSTAGNALFLQRSPTAPDFPGAWDFPGGAQEGIETPDETAIREAREEIGFVPDGKRQYHTRTKPGQAPRPTPNGALVANAEVAPLPDVDFTTFIQRVGNEFTPELNDEHIGFAWAPLTAPPQPLHPGCAIALARVGMNELDVARAMAAGRLTSPQRYMNLWLFAIRITGTDIAYRTRINEHVYRNPDNYLNDEFLARCNGLPVIWLHPKTAVLNSEEYSKRVVGAVFLPYIDGSEVWAIAKIHDREAAIEMGAGGLSTSPAVYFEDLSVNTKLVTDGGRRVLIEGIPSLLDHVAIAPLGVWDKGGPPAGIRSESREDSAMTPDEKAAADKAKKDADEREMADKAKKDAEEKEKARDDRAKKDSENIDKMLSYVDSMKTKVDSVCGRMDAFEAKEKEKADAAAKKDAAEDPEKVAADKAKKDAAEEKERADKAKRDADEKEEKEKKEREDSARKDSADIIKRVDALAKENADLRTLIPAGLGHPDHAAMSDAQARADSVYRMFDIAKGAPGPLSSETLGAYRRRLIRGIQAHSETWKAVDLTGPAYADDVNFAPVEAQVLADAERKANDPAALSVGELRMRTQRSAGGHTVNTWHGDPSGWMVEFSGPVRRFATGRFEAQK